MLSALPKSRLDFLDTTTSTTVEQLALTLRQCAPEQEIVISTSGLPRGVARLTLLHETDSNRDVICYCRLCDAALDERPEKLPQVQATKPLVYTLRMHPSQKLRPPASM